MIDHISWRAVFFMNVPLAIVVVLLSLRFMDESRDPSRTAATDWTGAALSVIGLGGIVFGLLEWTPLGPGHPLVVGSLVIGVLSLPCLLVRRAPRPERDDAAAPVPIAAIPVL